METKIRYEAAVKELKELMDQREEERKKELLEAVADSKKSYEEIMKFLKEK